jgi:hypothetical protein
MNRSAENNLSSALQKTVSGIRLTLSFAIPLALAFFTTACDKNQNESGESEKVVALTPLSAPTQTCAQGQTNYQPRHQNWHRAPHAQYNVVPYGYDFNGQPIQMGPYTQGQQQHGFCGCPTGSQAMCDARYGLVCVPTQHLHGHNIAWWQLGPSGFAFTGYAGYAGYGHVLNNPVVYRQPMPVRRQRQYAYPQQQYASVQLSCATQVGQTCQVGMNSCGDNAYCRPIAPNAPIGVCAR